MRELQGEGGALPDRAFHLDGAMKELRQVTDQRQADAVTAGAAGPGFIDPVEAVKDSRQMLGGNADAIVGDADGYALRRGFEEDVDFAASWCIFVGIFEQIADDLPE